MEKTNGVATAADFRLLAEAAAWDEPMRIQLPKSGLAIVLRRPTKFYWALRRSAWPAELLEKIDRKAAGEEVELSREELVRLFREDAQMLNEAFVQPKFSLSPDFNQFDPRWLPDQDAEFVLQYLRGQVLADGQSLEKFPRGEPASTAGSGDHGP